MLENYIREPYQRILVDPVVKTINNNLAPNTLTMFAGIAGISVLPCLYFDYRIFAIFLILFSGYLDTLDGTLARFSGRTSDWGSVLDISMDRLVEFIIIFSLWIVSPETRSFWVIMMLGSVLLCITSFLVIGVFTANDTKKGFYYSPGLMERSEAFVFFIAMILWPAYFSKFALVFSCLVLLTAFIRLTQFYRASGNIRQRP